MKISSAQDVFEVGLQKLYSIKKDSVESQGELVEFTTDPNTQQAIEEHRGLTRSHVTALEEVFDFLGMEPETMKSEGSETLISECKDLLQSSEDEQATNLLVLETVLKAEHLEVAILKGLQSQVVLLGENSQRASQVLQQMNMDDQNAINQAVSAAGQIV